MGAIIEPEDGQSTVFRATIISLLVITFIAFVLRVISRVVARLGLWWDDYLVLLSELVLIAAVTVNLLGIKSGFGTRWQAGGIEDMTAYKLIYANIIFYLILTTLTRSSILCLYLRIVPHNRGFTAASYSLLAMVIAWGSGSLLAAVFQCSPIQAAWKPKVAREYCINLQKYHLSTNIVNNILCLAVLLLPIPMLWPLTGLSTKRKIAIALALLLGTFTCATSFLRSVALAWMRSTDPGLDYFPAIFWGLIEINLSVICSCLLTMAPLLQAILGVFCSPATSNIMATQRRPSIPQSRHSMHSRGFSRLEENVPVALPKGVVSVRRSGALASITEGRILSLHAVQVSGDGVLQMAEKEMMV